MNDYVYRVIDLSDNILFIELPIGAQNVDCFSDELCQNLIRILMSYIRNDQKWLLTELPVYSSYVKSLDLHRLLEHSFHEYYIWSFH